MIDHTANQLALRTQLLLLAGPTTGSATLSATATGYARASGSFVTDGFRAGMEVTPTGFTQTTVCTITAVTALTMTVKDGRTVQSSGAARTLAVGLPATRAWENAALVGASAPVVGVPYVAEEYLPGGMRKVTTGSFGELEAEPMYVVRFHGVPDTGFSALGMYRDAVLDLFPPTLPLTVGSDFLRVRHDVAPSASQIRRTDDGRAVVTVSIPLSIRTANSR